MNNRKVYARQIPPEYQESPLAAEAWPENVAVFGNRDSSPHMTGIFKALEDGMRAAQEEWDDMQSGSPLYNSWAACLADNLRPVGRGPYTRPDRLEWKKILSAWDNNPSNPETFARAAEMVSGKKYSARMISGCCQGEWQYIVYPAEYGREWLAAFECEYFNTGTEWEIHDGPAAPEIPDEISGYCIYCVGNPRAEIAEAENVPPENVVLYAFDGWARTAKYTEGVK